jgi:hypothetical protein
MAFTSKPFPVPAGRSSFVRHEVVQRYLEDFAAENGLERLIRFGSPVTRVTRTSPGRPWRVEVGGSEPSTLEFDAVVVASGHFEAPFVPDVPGMADHFQGRVSHSSTFDDPADWAGKSVLVVGGGASGVDIARDLVGAARHVVLSSRRHGAGPASVGAAPKAVQDAMEDDAGVVRAAALMRVASDGRCEFSDGASRSFDEVVFCTGYRYEHPFLRDFRAARSDEVDGALEAAQRSVWRAADAAGERAVRERSSDGAFVPSLHRHIFDVYDPTLCFVGLPFKNIPFPMFEQQSRCIAAALSGLLSGGDVALPPLAQRIFEATAEVETLASAATPKELRHMLGDEQWAYARGLCDAGLRAAVEAQIQAETTGSESAPLVSWLRRFALEGHWDARLACLEKIYNDVGTARSENPKGYREKHYALERAGSDKQVDWAWQRKDIPTM